MLAFISWTEEKEARLLAQCHEHLRDVVVTALHTGFRRNELLNLRPGDIDFTRGLVRVRAGYGKNGEGRSVPTTNTLKDVLRRVVTETEALSSSTFFRNRLGAPVRVYALPEAFENAVQRAGLVDFHFTIPLALGLPTAPGLGTVQSGRNRHPCS